MYLRGMKLVQMLQFSSLETTEIEASPSNFNQLYPLLDLAQVYIRTCPSTLCRCRRRSAEVIDNILHISGIAVPGLEIPPETIMEKEPLADGRLGVGDLISFFQKLMKNRLPHKSRPWLFVCCVKGTCRP